MAEKSNDPLVVWQKLVGEMEKGFNTFANQAMASPEFSKVVNHTAGAQRQFGDLMEKYLVSMNMPSRAQMASMADRLQSIETQLGDIKSLLQQLRKDFGATPEAAVPPPPEVPPAPKPPRAKRSHAPAGDQK